MLSDLDMIFRFGLAIIELRKDLSNDQLSVSNLRVDPSALTLSWDVAQMSSELNPTMSRALALSGEV